VRGCDRTDDAGHGRQLLRFEGGILRTIGQQWNRIGGLPVIAARHFAFALIEAGTSAKLAARPIVNPALRSVMAVALSAQRPLTRMAQETIRLLQSIGPPLLKG
jgi:hypothetical protein